MVGVKPRRGVKRVRDANSSPQKSQKKAKQERTVVPQKVQRNLELAEQIRDLFASDGFAERSANPFDILSNDTFDMIMKSLTDKKFYLSSYEKYCSHMLETKKRKQKTMDFQSFYLQSFHKLRNVNRRFADYFERRIKDVPKAEIGVKIQAKPVNGKELKTEEYVEDKVIYSIHNGYGLVTPNVCDTLGNIAYVLRFTRVTKHFIVFGIPLTDHLVESIKTIDTSEVEAAHFFDIPYVDFEGDVREKAKELVNRFPKAKVVDFNGVGFDYEVLFGEKKEDEEVVREDKVLTGSQMTRECLRLTAKATSLRGRRKAKRAKINVIKIRQARKEEVLTQIRSNMVKFNLIDLDVFDDSDESEHEQPIRRVLLREIDDSEDEDDEPMQE